jgi:hypothetical protein
MLIVQSLEVLPVVEGAGFLDSTTAWTSVESTGLDPD